MVYFAVYYAYLTTHIGRDQQAAGLRVMWHNWKLELVQQLAAVGGFDEWVRVCIGSDDDQPDSGVLADDDSEDQFL